MRGALDIALVLGRIERLLQALQLNVADFHERRDDLTRGQIRQDDHSSRQQLDGRFVRYFDVVNRHYYVDQRLQVIHHVLLTLRAYIEHCVGRDLAQLGICEAHADEIQRTTFEFFAKYLLTI